MSLRKAITLVGIAILMLSGCEGGGDFQFGIETSTCDQRCGESATCNTALADMADNEKGNVSFPYGGRYEDGTGSYPEGLNRLNVTLTLTVEGEGKVLATFSTPDGRTTSVEATHANPGVITDDIKVRLEKEKPTELNPSIESAELDMTIQSVGAAAQGVQAKLLINDCLPPYCQPTPPYCK